MSSPSIARRTLAVAALGTFLSLMVFTAPLATINATATSLDAGVAGRTWVLSSMSVGLAAGVLAAAGIDEFIRTYTTARGRAALYAAARHIYLDEPHGDNGFWTRLSELSPDTLFIWGREDRLVPTSFMKHVERALPAARHVELDCGHIPQIERPRQTHAAIARFLQRDRARRPSVRRAATRSPARARGARSAGSSR